MPDAAPDGTSLEPANPQPRPSSSSPRRGFDPSWRHVAALVATALLGALLATDFARVPTDTFRAGDIAPRTVKAPFSFSYQDLATWEAARDAAGAASADVWQTDPGLPSALALRVVTAFRAGREALGGESASEVGADRRADAAQRFLDAGAFTLSREALEPIVLTNFPPEAEAQVLSWLDEAYAEDRLIIADDAAVPRDRRLRVERPQGEALELEDGAALTRIDDARSEITMEALQGQRVRPWTQTAAALARDLVVPNVTRDASASAAARAEAEARVTPEPMRVQRGETLFREGDRLTTRDVAKYRALQGSHSENSVAFGLLARFALNALTLLSLYAAGGMLLLQRREEDADRVVYASSAVLAIVLVLLKVVVVVAPGVATLVGNDVQPEAVWLVAPIIGGALLVSQLMGVRRGLAWVLSAMIPAMLVVRFDAATGAWVLLAGIASVALSRTVQDRMDAIRAGLQVGALGGAFMVLMHFVTLYGSDGELSLATTIRPLWTLVFAVLGGLGSGFFVLGLVPVFERFGFVTDHRMLELASLNHPLMRQLMLQAPGTYHHSVIVGTLAEAACDKIGANGTQAKIAAYFHDIGKTRNASWFVENQRGGANRHGDLDPATSAQIIIAHVTEGARMAREHRLPQPIIDNILMHHGTGLLQFFFAKAQMQAKDPSTVDESTYRYPGPKPNTREAGVIMLADKVEAATRTIQAPNEDNIRAMIQRIVNSVMADGQFSECPLTFREIHDVVEVFVNVLMGIHHQRIEYPQTRAVSRAGAPAEVAVGKGAPGTITLELEAPPVLHPERTEVTDDTTDYESVRNLPHGKA